MAKKMQRLLCRGTGNGRSVQFACLLLLLGLPACERLPDCSARGSQTLFTADFDDDQVGSAPAPSTPLHYGPPGAALNIQGASNTVEVVNSAEFGSQALMIARNGGTPTRVDAVVGDVGHAPYTTGVYYIEFRAHGAVIAPGLIAATAISLRSTDDLAAAVLRLSDDTYQLVEGASFVPLTDSYDPGTAHFVHIELDLDARRATICIDDALVAVNREFWQGEFEDLHALRFLAPPTITEGFPTSYVVDDIRITTAPFDPSASGPYAVGEAELDDPTGISGITDPAGLTGPTYAVTLAWAKIMYPATTDGIETPVSGARPSYPIALFLHGRHRDCDYDGDGPGLFGGYTDPWDPPCADENRIPSHEGYDYIMERLASHGIFSISVSAHQIQHDNGAFNYDARGRLILTYLDKLRDWNDNGTDPFNGLFAGKLDLNRIALSGHSRGGEGVVAAQALNQAWPTPHSIVAVNAIAPTDQDAVSWLMTDAPYFLLMGARDGDVANMQGFRTYDRAFPEGMANRRLKAVAWVYGANHNYFNTAWTDAAALGSANPWAGSLDDAENVVVAHTMPAAEQRHIARATIVGFFRWHLQGIDAFKKIFTGRLKPAGMENHHVYWTYQDAERKAVDDFEQSPLDPNKNTLGGPVTGAGFTTFTERLLNHDGSDYTSPPLRDVQFFHDTRGMKLAWTAPQTYVTEFPGGLDVSMYTHLTFRVAKRVTGTPTSGPSVNLFVSIEDAATNAAEVRTDQFDMIPHPYQREGGAWWCPDCQNQAQLTGVRIPLSRFKSLNPSLLLTSVVKITIRTEGSGEIGVDDIEFGK